MNNEILSNIKFRASDSGFLLGLIGGLQIGFD